MNSSGQEPAGRRQEAVQALCARGVSPVLAEELQGLGTPDQILAACRRWDDDEGVGAGALVYRIRAGDFAEPEPEPAPAPTNKAAQLRARSDAYARRFPVGAIAEPHRRMIERRWPDDIARALELGHDVCDGDMIVVEAIYPLLTVECDRCDFEAAYPVRGLNVLGGLLEPVPDPEEQAF